MTTDNLRKERKVFPAAKVRKLGNANMGRREFVAWACDLTLGDSYYKGIWGIQSYVATLFRTTGGEDCAPRILPDRTFPYVTSLSGREKDESDDGCMYAAAG